MAARASPAASPATRPSTSPASASAPTSGSRSTRRRPPPPDLPAGPYIRFDATQVDLTLLGEHSSRRLQLRAGDARRWQHGHGDRGRNVSFSGRHGRLAERRPRRAGDHHGRHRGRARRDVALHLPGDAAFSGTFALAVNTGHPDVHTVLTAGDEQLALDLPGGPYVRIAGTGVTLSIAGQTLTGDFGFETVTDFGADGVPGGATADTQVTRIALANVTLTLGGGILTVANGTGSLLVKADGHRRRLRRHDRASTSRTSPSRATCACRSTRRRAPIDETFELAGAPVHLLIDAGPRFFQVGATNVKLNVLGQSLSGDFGVKSDNGVVTISAENVDRELRRRRAHGHPEADRRELPPRRDRDRRLARRRRRAAPLEHPGQRQLQDHRRHDDGEQVRARRGDDRRTLDLLSQTDRRLVRLRALRRRA